MGAKMACCKKQETFGMDSSKFETTYSPIFAPFLVNVVVKLLNDTGDRSFDLQLEDFISRWGGGITLLRECCKKNTLDPEDKQCDWDTLVARCANATPLSHNVWVELLRYNKIKVTTSETRNVENLLMQWVENGHKYRTHGPYPKAAEQEIYIQDSIPPRISEILNYAIINDVFADCYVAMQQSKKGKIRDTITGPALDKVTSASFDELEMSQLADNDHKRQKSMKERAIELDIRPTDKESTRIHPCLWFGILLIAALYVIIMMMGNNQYMVMSWMNYSQDNKGFYWQDWGWKSSTIHDDTETGLPLSTFIDLEHSARIQNDIAVFIVIVFLMVLAFLVTIIFVLLMRIKEKKGYYFYIGRIKVPQRPVIYGLFEMIVIVSLCLVLMFTMLLIYGMVELIPYARVLCLASGSSECRALVFPAPHIGLFILICVPFVMSCLIYKYTAQLDYKLDYKTMRIYYPEHYGKLASNAQGIYLYDLLDGIATIKKLLLFMLFAACLQESGMIIWVHVTNTGSNSSYAYLQPLGLNNVKDFPGGGSWVDAGVSFSVFIPIFMIFNFILLCYFIHVFLNWKVYKVVKYIFLLLVTAEIVIWFILGLVFYFDFNAYWNKNGLGQKITDIGSAADEVGFKNYWLPDYGILLHLLIWAFMLRLWYRITKAM